MLWDHVPEEHFPNPKFIYPTFWIQNIQNRDNNYTLHPTKLDICCKNNDNSFIFIYANSFHFVDQRASTRENKARFVSSRGEIWPRTKRELEAWNHGGGVLDLKHRDQFPSTMLSWSQHGNGIFIRRTSPVIPENAIFILQGKTRMLRPRMLMVSKDRNENEERIKLCSNHREFRQCDDSFLHRGFAHSLVKRKSYRWACKINIKIKHRFTRSKTFLWIEEGVSLKISSDLV